MNKEQKICIQGAFLSGIGVLVLFFMLGILITENHSSKSKTRGFKPDKFETTTNPYYKKTYRSFVHNGKIKIKTHNGELEMDEDSADKLGLFY
jgi:hypothetical protein